MTNLYRNKQWLEFRREFIEADGNCCSRCGRSALEDIVLQVHHKIYISGKLPWEYSHSDCETLCKGCHAREHGHKLPNIGWSFICEDDLGDVDGICELCGTSIRYAFTVHHPNWEPLIVGTNCCDSLTNTKNASAIKDSKKRYISHLNSFLKSPRWKLNRRNNLEICQKGFDIEIIQTQSGFGLWLNEYKGEKIYQSVDDAKRQIFKIIENGAAEKFIRKEKIKKSR